jgi:hypothetical protein
MHGVSARGSASTRCAAWSGECAENPKGEQELQVCREPPRAVPADAVVKELPSSRTQEREDMLKVRDGTRRPTKRRRIEWASPGSKEKHPRDTAADLEATRAEVPVRHAIAREVEYRPHEERRDTRTTRSAGGGPRGHMEGDDHGRLPSRRTPGCSPHVRPALKTLAAN